MRIRLNSVAWRYVNWLETDQLFLLYIIFILLIGQILSDVRSFSSCLIVKYIAEILLFQFLFIKALL